MNIIHYPHPVLRHKSKPIRRVDSDLRDIVKTMFELMYEAHGVGLAANQVNLPMRLFVVNLASDAVEGEEFVFINPIVTGHKGNEEKEEGCLSLPELYGSVKRPEKIKVSAYNLKGEQVEAELDGMFARVVQHENDHLDGVLFIDRLSETGALDAKQAIEDFEIEFAARRDQGEIPGDQEIADHLRQLEQRYC